MGRADSLVVEGNIFVAVEIVYLTEVLDNGKDGWDTRLTKPVDPRGATTLDGKDARAGQDSQVL
jgi:hypothetical protein